MARLDLEIDLHNRLFVQLEAFTYQFIVAVIRCQFDFAVGHNDVFKACLELLCQLPFEISHCHYRIGPDLEYFKGHWTVDRQESLVELASHPVRAWGRPDASLDRVDYLCPEGGSCKIDTF